MECTCMRSRNRPEFFFFLLHSPGDRDFVLFRNVVRLFVHTPPLSCGGVRGAATLSLSVLFSRSGAVLEHRVLRRGRFRPVVFQVHPGRVLVGRGHHDDSRIRWHEVTKREQRTLHRNTTRQYYTYRRPITLNRSHNRLLPTTKLLLTTRPSPLALPPPHVDHDSETEQFGLYNVHTCTRTNRTILDGCRHRTKGRPRAENSEGIRVLRLLSLVCIGSIDDKWFGTHTAWNVYSRASIKRTCICLYGIYHHRHRCRRRLRRRELRLFFFSFFVYDFVHVNITIFVFGYFFFLLPLLLLFCCFSFVFFFQYVSHTVQMNFRCGAILERGVLRRSRLREFLLQVHPGRILVGCCYHDDCGLWWHDVWCTQFH